MRLLTLSPNPHHSNLVVMALGDSDDAAGCYQYQVDRQHSESLQEALLRIVFTDSSSSEKDEVDGITVESLLAICEDQAKQRAATHPSMGRVVLQLQGALRALTAERHDMSQHDVKQGENSIHVTTMDATQGRERQGSHH